MDKFAPLLTKADYENIPEDPGEAFVVLEEIARTRMLDKSETDERGYTWFPLRGDYMSCVSGLAQAFGISDVSYNFGTSDFDDEYYRFRHTVDVAVTKINALHARRTSKQRLRLSDTDKRKIAHHISRLRELIKNSNLPSRRRRTISDRLDEVEAELVKPRVNMLTILTAMALVAATTRDVQEIAKDAARSAYAIVSIIGETKLVTSEAAEPQRITDQSGRK